MRFIIKLKAGEYYPLWSYGDPQYRIKLEKKTQ